jgi:N-acetylglucosaminyl-diphospho-decaprenol L-rhamnosyltransferase
VDLSIIIVNWNSVAELRRCLSSIYARRVGLIFQIIVIDNASYDGSGDLVAAEFPSVFFIQSDVNAGFAAANNRAVKSATGRHIVFLNPDTELGENALELLSRELDERGDAGIAGPRLLNDDGTFQNSVQAFPGLANQALDTDFLRRLFPNSILWGGAPSTVSAGDNTFEVDSVSGACLMISRRLFQQVGGFTEDFFMYSEDVDLCWKVRNAGGQVLHVPAASVIHTGGQSSSRRVSHFSSVLQCDSRFRFFRRTRGSAYARTYCLMMTLIASVRLVILGLAVVSTVGKRKSERIHSLGKWIRILGWSIGGQRWASRLNASVPRTRLSD